MKLSRIAALCIAVTAVALLTISPALASERITGGNITIDDDVDDDLYVTGETVVVNATIDGDLIVLAKSLTLNGTVTGDLIFGGQWLVINGTVEDDMRAGGMNLIISDGGVVQDDVNAGAFAFEMQPGSSVGGDVYVGASQALVTDVAGTVMAGGNSLRVDGTVGGDVVAGVGNPEDSMMMNPAMFGSDPSVPVVSQLPGGLSFGPKAKVEGDLSYSANAAVSIRDGVVAGSVKRSMQSSTSGTEGEMELEAEDEGGGGIPPFAKYLGYVLGSFIMLLAVGWVLQRIAPNFLNGTLETLRLRTLASFGAGFFGYLIAYLVIPATLVLVIVLVILPLAGTDLRLIGILGLLGLGTFTAFTFITNWVAPILMALLIGTWLTRLLGRDAVPSQLASMALGLAVLVVVMAIPFVGRFIVALIIGMMGFGAILLYLWPRRTSVVLDPAKTPPPDRTVSMEPKGV